MLQLILRGLAAGFIVVGVSEIAGRFPRLGALVLTVPVVPVMVLLMMYLKGADLAPVCALSREMLCLILVCLPVFIPLALANRLQLSFWAAYAAGLLLMSAAVTAYIWLAPKNG
ncbi:MAG TPA: hypothetical protein VHP11_10395 [Tepidisphaeraceae bacterium]|nr:hypothetical protein [Tepidisphaeraceae bacterium]